MQGRKYAGIAGAVNGVAKIHTSTKSGLGASRSLAKVKKAAIMRHDSMIRFVLPLLVCLSPYFVAAQDAPTAKQALNAAQNALPPNFSSRVIEMTGTKGTTQPRIWRIVSSDPSSPGGIRVAEVRDGQLHNLSTPPSRYTSGAIPTINLETIPTDSLAAFQAANAEATRAGVGFDSVDYALRIDTFTGKPVWVLTLLDRGNHPVGTLFVSATTGRIVRAENLHRAVAPPRPPPPTSPVSQQEGGIATAPPPSSSQDPAVQRSQGFFQQADDEFNRTKYFFKKGFRTAGGSLQEFFTGSRTIDRKYRESAPPPSGD